MNVYQGKKLLKKGKTAQKKNIKITVEKVSKITKTTQVNGIQKVSKNTFHFEHINRQKG